MQRQSSTTFWAGLFLVIVLISARVYHQQRTMLGASPAAGRNAHEQLLSDELRGELWEKAMSLPKPEDLKVDLQAFSALKDQLSSGGIEQAESLKPLFPSSGGMVYHFIVPGDKAIALWKQLRPLVEQTGHWPVVMGDLGNVDRIFEFMPRTQPNSAATTVSALAACTETSSPEQIVAQASKLNVPQWFAQRHKGTSPEQQESTTPEDDNASPDSGKENYTLPYSMDSHKPLARVYVALVPARQGWEVPAVLAYGGWNECPTPDAQVAVLRYWNECYGAELVCMGCDTIEMRVERPPATAKAAQQLAREQYGYCFDIVDQGSGSLRALGNSLQGAKTWFFWWD